MVGPSDIILNFIAVEKSAAVLRAMRTRAIKAGEWSEKVHQGEYSKKIVQLEKRWNRDV